jgi:glycosyltransferase involved in cell wall biosynthesis
MSCDDATGIGRIVNALARKFSERGHEVTVVAQHIEHLPEGIRGIRFIPVPLSGGLSRVLFNFQTRRQFRSHAFDIVNAFGVGRGASVVTAQSCHAAGVDLQNAARRHRLVRRGVGLFDAAALNDERRLMTSPETKLVIGVSNLVKDQLLRYYPLPSEKIRVIPNGIHVDGLSLSPDPEVRALDRRNAGFGPFDFGLLFIGNEFDRKGLQTIIEAMGRVRDEHLKLAVIGGDNPEMYRRRARELRLEHRIRFLGRMGGPEKYFHAADALIHPAWYEPFGMVIIEAMAAGLPVIASASAGALEGLTHETHALFLKDHGDADELAGALKRLREDVHLRQTLASRGKEVSGRFSWDTVSKLTLAAYVEVAGVRESSP